MKNYIVALDQGTTSSRAILFDRHQRIVAVCQREFTQIYPREGWVEHDPTEIWATQFGVMQEALIMADARPEEIAAIGIANQRETTVVWDKSTGKPIYNAIVWQCRRTAPLCDRLQADGLGPYIRGATGLIPDAYFSGTKLKWILDNVPGARDKANRGELLFGTIDSWLVWNLTGGTVHATDVTNASRTMLYNIKTLSWDKTILDALKIPESVLPEVKSSSEVYGTTAMTSPDGKNVVQGIPIAGIAGDQQAALFGQAAFSPGDAKNTYGTGCFLLMNVGHEPVDSKNGLLTTIAVGIDGRVEYALEGSIFVGGAVVQWLRDELKMIDDSTDTAYFASKVSDNGGVYVVPAFVGLGAPYWDMYARGAVLGLTRGSNRNHIIRAALESIAYQTRDVLDAMEQDMESYRRGETPSALTGGDSSLAVGCRPSLRVDGGASRNAFLMQFQADLIGKKVVRPVITETTALGAAYLAGLAVGFWSDREEIRKLWTADAEFIPALDPDSRDRYYNGWKKAVGRTREWAREEGK